MEEVAWVGAGGPSTPNTLNFPKWLGHLHVHLPNTSMSSHISSNQKKDQKFKEMWLTMFPIGSSVVSFFYYGKDFICTTTAGRAALFQIFAKHSQYMLNYKLQDQWNGPVFFCLKLISQPLVTKTPPFLAVHTQLNRWPCHRLTEQHSSKPWDIWSDEETWPHQQFDNFMKILTTFDKYR